MQVYISTGSEKIGRPVKELKGFRKAFLQAGEKSEVEIEMERKYAFCYWDEGRDQWIVEKGAYDILVGNSSVGEFLIHKVEVEKTWWWSGL